MGMIPIFIFQQSSYHFFPLFSLPFRAVIKCICMQTGNLLSVYEGHEDLVTHMILQTRTTAIITEDNHQQHVVIENGNENAKNSNNIQDIFIFSSSIDGFLHSWNLVSCPLSSSLHLIDLISLRIL